MTHNFDQLNEMIDYRIKSKKLDPFHIPNRIYILEELKKKIEEDEEDLDYKFQMLQMINSEICVQRCRQHLKQLRLF